MSHRPEPAASDRPEPSPAPDPLAHAAPDSELAEAQLALGRPDEEEGDELQPATGDGGDVDNGDRAGGSDGVGDGGGPPDPPGGELAVPAAPLPAAPLRAGNRLVTFVQGSWRELQRVQWPDRRQVMQATGVVIGFVIVAGAFLGLADTIAGKLVTLILK
ncbi:MAG: preprotein translocase subunit SecE [Solirubrobacterales bacterium]|nr:MAG: preprotein translocase subunit SecE [Solirubrobacterales bacterium]